MGDSPWSGDRYEGGWSDGEKFGHGVYVSCDGTTYDGQWLFNKKCGHGCTSYKSDGQSLLSNFTWCDGDVYDGEFVDNMRHGACEYVDDCDDGVLNICSNIRHGTCEYVLSRVACRGFCGRF